jgi:hypothetical protein
VRLRFLFIKNRMCAPGLLFKPFRALDGEASHQPHSGGAKSTLKEEIYASYAVYANIATEMQKVQPIIKTLHAIKRLSPDERRAFLVYLFSEPRRETTYEALKVFAVSKLKPADIDILREQPVYDRALATMLSNEAAATTEFPQLTPLAKAIKASVTSVDDRYRIQKLLESEGGHVPVFHLLSSRSLEFFSRLIELNPDQRKLVYGVAADPVSAVVDTIASAEPEVAKALGTFRSLKAPRDREGLLHYLAISFYRAGGDASLGPFDVLVAQARIVSETVANVFASFAAFPIFALAVILGGLLARALLAHDKMLDVICVEREKSAREQYKLGTPTDLVGREDTIAELADLSGRGWGSIAVVGRRGVGKSRVLYSVYQRSVAAGAGGPPSVGVWITAPAQFKEEEFVASLFERLARASEAAIAESLGAEPLSVRGMSLKVIRDASTIVGAGAIAVGCLLYDILHRLARNEIVVVWIPIYAVLAAALVTLAIQWFLLQPLDLSPWLNRERSQSPHAVLLYRRIREAFSVFMPGFVDPAIARQEAQRRQVSIVLGIVLLVACALCALGSAATSGDYREFFFNTALISGLAGGFFLLLRGPVAKEPRSLGVIALISEYRSFAAEVVQRLRQGAIGGTSPEHGRVVVCLDELDKIVDFDELRAALRRIKTVFEVEGCYYIMSLAEDALRRLYLGAVDGKTEVDSALDHVVELAPLGRIEMVRVVSDYFRSLGEPEVDERIKMTVAALSFGVSRDALRVADEWHASKSRSECAGIVRSWRLRRVRYTDALDAETREACEGDARVAMAKLASKVESLVLSSDANTPTSRATLRTVVMIWAVSLLEVACEAALGEFGEIVEACMKIGYQIGDGSVGAAVIKLQATWSKLNNLPKPAAGAAPSSLSDDG